MNPETLKIRFGCLLTMDGGELRGGEMTVSGGRIRSIGREEGGSIAREIDLRDCLVMPGFVNAHCHLALSALKGKLSRGVPFADWVKMLVEQDAGIPDEARRRAMQEGADEMVRSGVTTVADYLGRPELLEEYARFPFRQIVFLEAIGFPAHRAGAICDGIRDSLRKASPDSGRIRLGIAPHAPYSVSPDLFRALRKLAEDFDAPFSCHVAELEEETEFLKTGEGSLRRLLESRNAFDPSWKVPGVSPLRYLEELGILGSLIAVHLNHLEGEAARLARNSASAVFCAGSTSWFGRERWLEAKELLRAGVPVGLGTDSLASNDSLNFLEELRKAESMQKDLSRMELLGLATRRGAEALGLRGGVAAEGFPADLIAFRSDWTPGRWSDVPFERERFRADWVMIDGREIVSREDA